MIIALSGRSHQDMDLHEEQACGLCMRSASAGDQWKLRPQSSLRFLRKIERTTASMMPDGDEKDSDVPWSVD